MKPRFEKFGVWRPDQGTYGTGQSEEVSGVIKTETGWRPFPGLQVTNNDPVPGVPASSTPCGLFFARDRLGNVDQFVAVYDSGSTANSKIWELGSDGHWASRSTDWSLSDTSRWRTVQWDDALYATNQIDGLRKWITASGTNFEPVYYTTEPSTTDPVKPKFVAVARDFLVVANLIEPGAGGERPNKVAWSSINDPDSIWLTGDEQTLSDSRTLPDAGAITGLIGGEFITVVTEEGLFRGDYVGPPSVWSWNRIDRAAGCIEPNSVVAANAVTYYYAPDGWKSFDGQQVQGWGAEKVDRFFGATATKSELSRMSAYVDPLNQLIVWGFHATRANVDLNDCLLVLNYQLGEPSFGELNHSLLGGFTSPALDVDTMSSILVEGLGATDVWEGKWIGTISYAQNSVVSYKADESVAGPVLYYRATAATTIGNDPITNTPDEWEVATGVDAPIDNLGQVPFDSSIFKPDAAVFAALSRQADGSDRVSVFSGYPESSVLTTPEFGGPIRARLGSVRMAVEGDDVEISAQVGTRNRLGVPVKWSPVRKLPWDGAIKFNADARYHRVRVIMTGAWRDAVGIFHESKPTSGR